VRGKLCAVPVTSCEVIQNRFCVVLSVLDVLISSCNVYVSESGLFLVFSSVSFVAILLFEYSTFIPEWHLVCSTDKIPW
jgi:hypothetical protein